jgi:predicted nucleotidyltransferase
MHLTLLLTSSWGMSMIETVNPRLCLEKRAMTRKRAKTPSMISPTKTHASARPAYPMSQDKVAELLDEIVRRIVAVSDPQQIILFGSYARGDTGPDSDLDLLVVKDVEAPRQESIQIRRALRGLLVPIDVIVATPQHINQHRHTVGLIYRPALQEGKVLYEQSAAI